MKKFLVMLILPLLLLTGCNNDSKTSEPPSKMEVEAAETYSKEDVTLHKGNCLNFLKILDNYIRCSV